MLAEREGGERGERVTQEQTQGWVAVLGSFS